MRVSTVPGDRMDDGISVVIFILSCAFVGKTADTRSEIAAPNFNALRRFIAGHSIKVGIGSIALLSPAETREAENTWAYQVDHHDADAELAPHNLSKTYKKEVDVCFWSISEVPTR